VLTASIIRANHRVGKRQKTVTFKFVVCFVKYSTQRKIFEINIVVEIFILYEVRTNVSDDEQLLG
jgi:hypothetical protein